MERLSRSATPQQNLSQHGGISLKRKLIPLHNVRSKVIGRKLPSFVFLVQMQVQVEIKFNAKSKVELGSVPFYSESCVPSALIPGCLRSLAETANQNIASRVGYA